MNSCNVEGSGAVDAFLADRYRKEYEQSSEFAGSLLLPANGKRVTFNGVLLSPEAEDGADAQGGHGAAERPIHRAIIFRERRRTIPSCPAA